MNIRIAVRGIIAKENKIFAVRLKPYRHAEASTYWCTPGGGIDDREDLINALHREIEEELGVIPKIGRLLYIQQFEYKDLQQMEFFFLVENAEEFEKIDLSQTTHGADEIAEYGFIDPKTTNILPKFLQEVNLSQDVSTQKPTQLFNYL